MKSPFFNFSTVKLVFVIILNCLITSAYAQSPYSIAPKWYFGRQAGMDFSGGAPVVMTGGQTNGTGQEATSTMCDRNGDVLFYSDSYRLYDGTHAFKQNVNGGTSSTNGSVSFPDPADPVNQFYYVTANQDPGGGGNNGVTLGIYYYHIQRTGTGAFNVLSGPTFLASNTQVSEQLCAGTDNNGGYWVVAHQGGGAGNGNQFWSWNFTATSVGAKQISSVLGTASANTWQGSLKINQCQNKLAAVYWSGAVEVYTWNNTTGMVTSLANPSYAIPGAFGYGCEFSPDGTKLYFTSMVGNQFYQMDLGTNAVTTFTGSSNNITEMGTLQLGPDNKIYVTNVSNFSSPNEYIGVVNNPNAAGAACNYISTGFLLDNTAAFYPSIYRGIANQAWINPLLNIDTSGACRILGFSYDFETYFGANVAKLPNSEIWNFGDGTGALAGLGATPTHTYAAGGNYTITLTVIDATCGKTWIVSRNIDVNGCNVPPPSCTTGITASIAPQGSITLDEATPQTVNFTSASTFDGGNLAPQRYFWNVGAPDTTNNVLSTTGTNSMTFVKDGTNPNYPQGNYTIYLIIKQGLCMDTTSINFNAQYFPPGCYSDITATIEATTELLLDGTNPTTVTFIGTNSIFDATNTATQNYFWSVSTPDTLTNVLSTTNQASLTFAYQGANGSLPQGTYEIYLIIKQGLCMDTVVTQLNVTRFYIPNLVTPNGDLKNDRFEITNTPGRFDMEVYNRWGDRVYAEKGYTDGWDLGNVSDGIYYFNIIDGYSDDRYKGWVQIIH